MISTTYGVVSTGQVRYRGYVLNAVRLFASAMRGAKLSSNAQLVQLIAFRKVG